MSSDARYKLQEFGGTVGAARRMARRARYIYIRFQTGPGRNDSSAIRISRGAFLTATKHKDVGDLMPCELYQFPENDYATLSIGGFHADDKFAMAS